MEQLKKMYGKQLPFIPVVDCAEQEIRIPEEEKQEVIDYITTGIEQHMRGPNCELDIAAKYIKDKMDGRFGPTWQCILGTRCSPGEGMSFDISYQFNCIVFGAFGNIAVLVFKS